MITLLIVVGVLAIVLTVFGIMAACLRWSDGEWPYVMFILGVFLVFIFAGIGLGAHTANINAQLLNSEYGTQYTAEQMFFSGKTIKVILEGSRQRIDGDLNIRME